MLQVIVAAIPLPDRVPEAVLCQGVVTPRMKLPKVPHEQLALSSSDAEKLQ